MDGGLEVVIVGTEQRGRVEERGKRKEMWRSVEIYSLYPLEYIISSSIRPYGSIPDSDVAVTQML